MDEQARAFLDGGGPVVEATIGRPGDYSFAIVGPICEAIASGMRMEDVAKLPGFPGRSTLFGWLATHQDFQVAYRGAMDWRSEADADWLMDIALDKSEDYKLEDAGGENSAPIRVLDKTAIERSKLACGELRWLMTRRAPKKYGEAPPVVIQPPAQPGQYLPGDGAKLIGQSATIEGNAFEASLRVFDEITGQAVSKVIAG